MRMSIIKGDKNGKRNKDRGAIPEEVKNKVMEIVEYFNTKNSARDDCYYAVRFRGKYCYLERSDYGHINSIFRLTYTGDMNKWESAIFKCSSQRYAPEEWMFPGSELLDGTVEGAMKAGLEAYPV